MFGQRRLGVAPEPRKVRATPKSQVRRHDREPNAGGEDVTKISWLILPRMLEVAEQIYAQVRRSKEGGGPPKAVAHPRAGSFRQLNPW